MNFYCDSQGVVFHVDAERIFQGSLGANKIRLIGQFPSTAQVLVAYELPDGTNTSPKIMTSVATLEQVQSPNGGLYSIWESLIGASPKIDDNGNVVTDDNGDVVYDLIPAITALYGTVRVQFFVYGASNGKLNGQVLAVASSSFTVEKGVPAEIPEFDLDDGTTLLQNILAVVANYGTVVENAAADAQAAANSAAASASAAEAALNGAVKKTGDEMSGPLLFNSPRTLNQALVSPNGLEVGVGVDGESVAVDKTEYGNGGITKTEGNTIKSFALPEESGTLATEEYVDNKADVLLQDIAVVNAILEQSGIVSKYKATIEDTYSERVTADGANILDGSKAKLEKVVGSTVACRNLFDIDNLFEDPRNAVSVTKTNNSLRLVANNTYASICLAQLNGLTIGENYTISFEYLATVASANATFGLSAEYDKEGQNSITIDHRANYPQNGKVSKTITATAQTMYFTSYFQRGASGENGELNDFTLSNIQIEKGNTATEYQLYFTGLKSASFGGIESTNADGTETATLNFPKTETPLGTTIDFENKKITDYGVDLVFNGNEDCTFRKYTNGNKTYNSIVFYDDLLTDETRAVGISTDGTIQTEDVYGVDYWWLGINNSAIVWLGVLDSLGFTSEWTDKDNPTIEENLTALDNFKAYLRQRYADGNPVKIRYISSTLQSETDFSAEQSAVGNEYTAYNGGTEKVLENDGAEYGAENTLFQNYIIVTEV